MMQGFSKQSPGLLSRRWLFIVLALAALQGCAGIQKLREAMETFSKGASIENASRIPVLNPVERPDIPMAAGFNVPQYYYRTALRSLESIDKEEEKSLKEDGLWVTKLALEAMCLWKLGQVDKARGLAEGAVPLADQIREPRDRVILRLLPGLIKNDQAYSLIHCPPEGLRKAAEENGYNDVIRLLDQQRYDEAKKKMYQHIQSLLVDEDYGAKKHVLEVSGEVKNRAMWAYVIQVHLSLYKNLLDAKDRFLGKGTPLEADELREVTQLLADLERALKLQQKANSEVTAIHYVWAQAFGIN